MQKKQRQKPWVIVTNPGTDDEEIFGDYFSYLEAAKSLKYAPEGSDIMKRQEDGNLTTEF